MTSMPEKQPSLLECSVKAALTHTVTYFVFGLLASTIMGYAGLFAQAGLSGYMRPISDPWVMAGPLFQPIRGLLFGIILYLLREVLLMRKNGWLTMWAVLAVIGIFDTFGPAPGSLEGMLYTRLAFSAHLRGLPEVLLQSLALSAIVFYWVNHPARRWINWVMGVAFAVTMALPALGLLVRQA
jgi:hypothetical protein